MKIELVITSNEVGMVKYSYPNKDFLVCHLAIFDNIILANDLHRHSIMVMYFKGANNRVKVSPIVNKMCKRLQNVNTPWESTALTSTLGSPICSVQNLVVYL